MRHLDFYILAFLSLAFLALKAPWAVVVIYLVFQAKLEFQAFLAAKEIKAESSLLQKIDWLEKEVKALNQIQNLKNKF